MEKVILHIDMDAFFAAVEQRDHPEYRGKPVIVGADPRQGKGRGVVSTCSYEARKFGVHSAMPIMQAYKRCPHGIYVPPNGHLYGQVSEDIFKIFYEFTDLVEPLSIDEAFLDITGTLDLFKSKTDIGQKIKSRIVEEQGITASVGIAPNKFLAKIASDLEKPDGLVIVQPDKIREFLDPLHVSRMWGAGKKTIVKLEQAGIHTIGDLAALPLDVLKSKFGKLGEHFHHLAKGQDNRDVHPEHGVKSVSNEITFSHDITDINQLDKTLLQLTEKVAYRLRKQDLKGRTIHLKLRYEGFETHTRNRTLKHKTANTEIIHKNIMELFKAAYQTNRRVRLLGVGVSGFAGQTVTQLSMFDKPDDRDSPLDEVADLVKSKFGRNSISRAASMRTKKNDRFE
jgi:nucleotidyltransferase/DNA polymerase involved in DNA repair